MMANITLQEVKLHCRIDVTDTLEDSLLVCPHFLVPKR